MALPITSLIKHRSKRIIRYAMRGKLPASILTSRHKTGIQSPTVDWLNDPAVRSEITDMVNDRSFAQCPSIEGEKFRRAWMETLDKRLLAPDCATVWKVLNLFIWDRIVRDNVV